MAARHDFRVIPMMVRFWMIMAGREVWEFDSAAPHPLGTSRSLLSHSALLRFTQEAEVSATMIAGVRREFREDDGTLRSDPEKEADTLAHFDGGTGEEAVVATTPKAWTCFGQER